MFSRLSPRTIYQRFHMPYPRVPEWAVALFANANRYDGGSLFAFAGNEIAGHAMYVRSHSGQDAEMAIVVEDAWQSKGIGKLLVYELAEEARSQGIETFTGEILRENRRMLNLFNAAFAEVECARKGDSYLVRAPLRTLRLAVDPVRTLRHAA